MGTETRSDASSLTSRRIPNKSRHRPSAAVHGASFTGLHGRIKRPIAASDKLEPHRQQHRDDHVDAHHDPFDRKGGKLR